MATLAEMFINDTSQTNQQPLSKSDVGWQMGAQLAERQQKAQQFQQQIQQQKQELEVAKWDKVGKLYELWDKMPDGPAKKTLGSKVIPANLNAMNLSQDMNPAVAEMMNSDPQLGTFLTSKAKSGDVTQAEIVAATKDSEKFAELITKLGISKWADEKLLAGTSEKYGPEILKAEGEASQREASIKAAGMRAGGTQDRFDTKLKTTLADKVNALGIPDIKVSINELNGVIPGGIDGYKSGTSLPGISGADAALPTNRLKGTALKVRQSAQSVGNMVLKLRSGAAVTDGEAMRTLAELGMVPTIGEGGTWTGLTWKGTTSPDAFVNGMKRVRNIVAAKEKTFKNAYGDEAYSAVVGDVVGTVDPKVKARKYLEQFPNGKDAARAKQILGE